MACPAAAPRGRCPSRESRGNWLAQPKHHAGGARPGNRGGTGLPSRSTTREVPVPGIAGELACPAEAPRGRRPRRSGAKAGAPCRTRTCGLLVRRQRTLKADRSRPNETGVGCDPQQSSEAASGRVFWNGLQYLASEIRPLVAVASRLSPDRHGALLGLPVLQLDRERTRRLHLTTQSQH